MIRDVLAICRGSLGRPIWRRCLQFVGATSIVLSGHWAEAATATVGGKLQPLKLSIIGKTTTQAALPVTVPNVKAATVSNANTWAPVKLTAQGNFYVGVGKADISGVMQQSTAVGWTMNYPLKGYVARQNARAFIVASNNPATTIAKDRVVIVTADIWCATQVLHQEVIRRLRIKNLGNYYNDTNIIINGTHTHSGPAGYSTYLADSGAGGVNGLWDVVNSDIPFNPLTFEAHVAGIVEAIVAAHNNLKVGDVHFGHLLTDQDTAVNVGRASDPYNKNPKLLRDFFEGEGGQVDHALRMLWFTQGTPAQGATNVGMLVFFAVHPTNQPQETALMSPDLVGNAARRLEQEYEKHGYGKWVVGMANTNAGDQSTRLQPGAGIGTVAYGGDGTEQVKMLGDRLAKSVDSLVSNGYWKALHGVVSSRTRYVNMANYPVQDRYSGNFQSATTCAPRVSPVAMAGSIEGPGPKQLMELLGSYRTRANLIDRPELDWYYESSAVSKCQYPKVVRMPAGLPLTGMFSPMGFDENGGLQRNNGEWNREKVAFPHILPVTVARIGDFAIGTVPGEPTVTAGRKSRMAIAQALDLKWDYTDTEETDKLGDLGFPTAVDIKDYPEIAKQLGLDHPDSFKVANPPEAIAKRKLIELYKISKRVVVLGYTNAYSAYSATWHEYQLSQYEGAQTLFGPNTQGAYEQLHVELASDLRDGKDVATGDAPWCRMCGKHDDDVTRRWGGTKAIGK